MTCHTLCWLSKRSSRIHALENRDMFYQEHHQLVHRRRRRRRRLCCRHRMPIRFLD